MSIDLLDGAGLWQLLVLDPADVIVGRNRASGRQLSGWLLRKFSNDRGRIRLAALKLD